MPRPGGGRLDTCLVGLDYGGTAIKAVALAPDTGAVMAVAAVPTPVHNASCRTNGKVYEGLVDPDFLYRIGREVVLEVVRPLGDVAVALAVSSAGPPLVAVDETGRAVCPVLGRWDGLSGDELEEALPYDPERFYEIAGSPLQYYPPVFGLAWLAQRDPGRRARIARVLSIGGYIAARLTGVAVAEQSTAGASGAFDRRARTWSTDILRAGQLDPTWFPSIVSPGTLLGDNRDLLGGRVVRVVAGGHDYLCAALAAGVSRSDESLNLLGTWEMATRFVPIGARGGWGSVDGRPHPMLHDLHVMPDIGTYTLECWSGGQIEWARRTLKLGAADFFRAAESAPPQAPKGRWYAPFLGPQFFPFQAAEQRAELCGLDASVTERDIARAVLEGVAYLGARMVETLDGPSGHVAERVVLAGGASRSGLMAQLKADMLDRPIWVHQIPDLSAVGVALMAGVGVDSYRDLTEASHVVADQVTEVAPDHDRHRAYREVLDPVQPV